MGVCHETYLIMRVRDCNNVPWGRETDRGRPHPVPQECWKSEAKVCPLRFKEEGSPQLKGRSAKEPEALGSWPWQRPAIPAQSEEITWAQSVEPQCNKNVQANHSPKAAGQQSHQIAQPGTPEPANAHILWVGQQQPVDSSRERNPHPPSWSCTKTDNHPHPPCPSKCGWMDDPQSQQQPWDAVGLTLEHQPTSAPDKVQETRVHEDLPAPISACQC